jgi:hypothetical protein
LGASVWAGGVGEVATGTEEGGTDWGGKIFWAASPAVANRGSFGGRVRLPVVALLAGATFFAASVLLTLPSVAGIGLEASGLDTGFFFMRAVPERVTGFTFIANLSRYNGGSNAFLWELAGSNYHLPPRRIRLIFIIIQRIFHERHKESHPGQNHRICGG